MDAQIFPALGASEDSSRSQWSIGVEASLGMTGLFPDEHLHEEEIAPPPGGLHACPVTNANAPIPVLASTALGFNVGIGAHYHLHKHIDAGIVGSYSRRGTTGIMISDQDVLYDRTTVDYLGLQPQLSFGVDDVFGSVGLIFGVPVSATMHGTTVIYRQDTTIDQQDQPATSPSSKVKIEEEHEYNLLSSDQYSTPPLIGLEVQIMLPILERQNHIVSGGLIWNATLTNLVSTKNGSGEGNTETGAIQLGINWRFGSFGTSSGKNKADDNDKPLPAPEDGENRT